MKAVSRQSKTLMGIALLALGAYLWFNYLSQNNSSLLPPFLVNNQTISSITPSPTAGTTRTPTINSSAVSNNQDSLAVAPLSGSSEIQVVSPNINVSTTTAAREVIIVDLPFLVTEPPSENIEDSGVVSDGVRQNQHLRATVNPFSPIVIEETKEKNKQITASSNSSIQTVSGQSRPSGTSIVGQARAFKAPTELIKSTPLRTVTPAPSLANNLPRTLSNGTLSATPGILRNQNVVPPLASEVAAAKKAAEEAAALAEKARLEASETATLPVLKNPSLRTPHAATPSLAIVSNATQGATPASIPGLLQSGRDAAQIEIAASQHTNEPTKQVVNANTENTATLDDPNISGFPTEAGISELARYLRDYNFEYTGSVIGAVRSVGMFRTNVSATPITITLGQTIPKTDIVLTNLQNNQAEFTQGQDKVILNLDLRR